MGIYGLWVGGLTIVATSLILSHYQSKIICSDFKKL
jgi:hypothetical protein